jgi:hypothetical protein
MSIYLFTKIEEKHVVRSVAERKAVFFHDERISAHGEI